MKQPKKLSRKLKQLIKIWKDEAEIMDIRNKAWLDQGTTLISINKQLYEQCLKEEISFDSLKLT